MKNIDDVLHELTGSKNKVRQRSITATKRETAKQQILSDLLSMAVSFEVNYGNNLEKAIPLSDIRKYMGVEE